MSQPKRMSLTAEKSLAFYVEESQKLIDREPNAIIKAERLHAQELFKARGWPTRRDEEWQYTPLNGFLQHQFSISGISELEREKIRSLLPGFDVLRLVFVDGHFDDLLSDSLESLPKGLVIETTADLLEMSDDPCQLELNTKGIAQEPFALLNSMLFQDGINLEVAAHCDIEVPIYVLHVQTEGNHASVLRHRITLQENSGLTWLEHSVSLSAETVQMTNHLTEISIGKQARFKQYLVQEQSLNSFYFANQWISQAASSLYETLYVGLGGKIARHQNYVELQGEFCESQQNSICFAQASQVQDSRTHTQHLSPNGTSRQLHKFVLKDHARGVFNGMIKVARDAQKTDGQMDNKNLLLSLDAKMDTKPQLEIYADDVKCSHGSATGQLDENQVFYLQARGIRKAEAVQMITEAFLLEPLALVNRSEISGWLGQKIQKQVNHLTLSQTAH